MFGTARLTLRAPAPEDAPHLHVAILESMTELRPWIAWARTPPTLDVLRAKTVEARALMDRREYFAWRVYLKDTDVLIGSIDLHHWDWSIPKCEIGYWARTSHAGRGYLTEAVLAVMAAAAESLDVRRIEALCDTRNLPSQRLLDRAGFTRETVLRDHERDVDGALCDQIRYAWGTAR